ncbi:hypothetical protein LTR50_003624 [Elasticomyces elasticus]|nr:hypothetical protein LTR50_003624 [Elasticomyces elasticus]
MEALLSLSMLRALCIPRLTPASVSHIRGARSSNLYRPFSISPTHRVDLSNREERQDVDDRSFSQPAHKVSQDVSAEEKSHYQKERSRYESKIVEKSKDGQRRTPWMRDGSDTAPVARRTSVEVMTKGKLLTTPSRMLKLILPLTTTNPSKDSESVEPLALLVHPQQPLSYLERLIQSELPVLKDDNGHERIPAVHFRAQDSMQDNMQSQARTEEDRRDEEDEEHSGEQYDIEQPEETRIDGKVEKTGKISGGKKESTEEDLTDTMKAQIKENKAERPNFVKWSSSTEIGDFIRDAARGREFAVDIEGAPNPIYVGVPSFNDRTYYLRMRLRKTAQRIASLADVKQECDRLAHKSAQRVAQGGFAVLMAWWASVYWLTFKTSLGWDVMEPVTYLVGLSSLIGGYMWFLWHNREVSYRSAMNFTVSRRQSKLYDLHGFDIQKWESLVEEGNKLRREIKMIADEYDVEWDERKDEGDEKVAEALRDHRERIGKQRGKKDGDEEDD